MTPKVPTMRNRPSVGKASAEAGVVLLDGPDGVAITTTPEAAKATGENLILAAGVARKQLAQSKEDSR